VDPQSITITAEPLNVERCKFVVGVPVYNGGLRRFTAPHEAHGSPLAEALFAIPGAEVQEIIVSGNLVTVVKASTLPWQVLGKQIGAAIREALAGPRPAIAPKEEAPAGGVMLRMAGGCQGCGMADVTLRQGIEGMLGQRVPEVKGIMDITDHTAGENPYFAASKK